MRRGGGELLDRPGVVAPVECNESRIEKQLGALGPVCGDTLERRLGQVELASVVVRLYEAQIDATRPGIEAARRFEGVDGQVELLQPDRTLAGQPLELRIARRPSSERDQQLERRLTATIPGKRDPE